ncbi:hypothetical protein P9112_004316 [Eukaryota sp. TZLM1-RC]
MYRAIPSSNKLLEQKWRQRELNLHRQKLKKMKPAIDNKPPPDHRHVFENKKKQQIDEERFTEIERENYRLLGQISDIMSKSNTLDNSLSFSQHPGTLHRNYRKRELERITHENQGILHRIQTKPPTFSLAEWKDHGVRHRKYEQNLREVVPRTEKGHLVKQRKQSASFSPSMSRSCPAQIGKNPPSDSPVNENTSPDHSLVHNEREEERVAMSPPPIESQNQEDEVNFD